MTTLICIGLYLAVMALRGNFKRRLLTLIISGDQTLFAIITQGSAAPDETMSAAAYRLEQQGRWPGKLFRPIIDKIMFFDHAHCHRAYQAEVHGWQQGKL